MIDITTIIEAVITLIIALITAFVIPWMKTKIGADKLAQAQQWVTIAVQAAEMIYSKSGMGNIKKKYVLAFLEDKGYTYDEKSVNNMIEAAVLELQQKGAVNDGNKQ